MLTMLLERMEEKGENPENEDIYRDAAGTAYTGGADTVSRSMLHATVLSNDPCHYRLSLPSAPLS